MAQSTVLLLAVFAVLSPGLERQSVSGQCAEATQCLDTITGIKDEIAAAKENVRFLEEKLFQAIADCSFTCPDGFARIPNVRKCIKLVRESVTWDAAQAKCVSYNAKSHLAIIESAEEDNFVLARITALSDEDKALSDGFYIGGQRVDKTCNTNFVWKLPSGVQTNIIYSDFAANEPNCKPGGTEPCLEMYKGLEFKWNDVDCNAARRWAVCQYP